MSKSINYSSIDSFELKWRFAEDDSKWTVLPPEDLANFKPLTEDTAEWLWSCHVSDSAQHLMDIAARQTPPNRDVFGRCILEIDDDWTSTEEQMRVTQTFNSSIQISSVSCVYFFWNASSAVETTWDVFLRYWSDFCYPSDDSNVAVLPDAGCNLYYIEGSFSLRVTCSHNDEQGNAAS